MYSMLYSSKHGLNDSNKQTEANHVQIENFQEIIKRLKLEKEAIEA